MSSFELFDAHGLSDPDTATVGVLRTGRISLNEVAFNLLGGVRYVELLYDKESRRIALRPVKERTLASYAVTKHKKSPTYYVQSLAFFRHFQIDLSVSRRYSATLDGNKLVIDLRSDSITPARTLRDKGAGTRATRQSQLPISAPLTKAS